MPSTIQFDSKASQPKHGLVMIYDLEGFSQFFNQPDLQDYVPKFINRVNEAVSIAIYGGQAYWQPKNKNWAPLPIHPVQEKFLGDGAMYIWLRSEKAPFGDDFVTTLCNRLWDIKTFFFKIVKAAREELPIIDLPNRIRFGIARGTIYELCRKGSKQREYIGFCINLASRLQKYCPDLGFIASARVDLPQSIIKHYQYTRVVATQIKGFAQEVVLVDQSEWEALDPSLKEGLFEPINNGSAPT